MRKEIISFISENKIASITCLNENGLPYCFHCFYAFDAQNYFLFFKSSLSTQHAKFLLNNPNVAGSILPDKINFTALKGAQFSGKLIDKYPANVSPSAFYHKHLPMALTKPGQVWTIKLEELKMTDNSLLFGKKLEWHIKRE